MGGLAWEGPLEKEMATHSSILAWRIPWTEEPAGLQSMVLQTVGHDLATKPATVHSKRERNTYSVNMIIGDAPKWQVTTNRLDTMPLVD